MLEAFNANPQFPHVGAEGVSRLCHELAETLLDPGETLLDPCLPLEASRIVRAPSSARVGGLEREVEGYARDTRERFGGGPSGDAPGAADARDLYKAVGLDPTVRRAGRRTDARPRLIRDTASRSDFR